MSKSGATGQVEDLKGVFISFEGIDGSGKSTVAARVAEAVRATGQDVVLTREPGGTDIAEAIRGVILGAAAAGMEAETETLLFSAARAELVAKLIEPSLQRGAIVVTDRFADSTLAYQWGGRGLSRDLVEASQVLATAGCRPALTILLDLPVDIALGRRAADSDGVNRLDQESVDFHHRVREAYLSLAREEPERWRVIDAMPSPESVLANVKEQIDATGLLTNRLLTAPMLDGAREAL